MARWNQVNFINLLVDLKAAGKRKEDISRLLYMYDIPKIENLQRRLLEYVLSIKDDELRFKFMDMIVEAENLPILHDCYSILYSNLEKDEYILWQAKNVGSTTTTIALRYELSMKIISQSSILSSKQQTIAEYKNHVAEEEKLIGQKVITHKYRNKAAKRN